MLIRIFMDGRALELIVLGLWGGGLGIDSDDFVYALIQRFEGGSGKVGRAHEYDAQRLHDLKHHLLLEFLHLAQHHVALEAREVINEQYTVQVVDFVLNAVRQQAIGL